MSFFSTFNVFINILNVKQQYKQLIFRILKKHTSQKSPLNVFKGLCKILGDLKRLQRDSLYNIRFLIFQLLH
jgi:hypothetical protein